jgi:glycosyltransferase involved in cell wall biosynthesis
MNDEIFFSIILPTYNRQNKLCEAINSVLNQTIQNWELIIIDNHSIDKTSEIVESYKNNKIHFYKFNNRGNIAKSRNYGISKSTGKYLCFLDSDDYWKNDKLELTFNKIKEGYSFIYHDMIITKKLLFFYRKVPYCRKLTKPSKLNLIVEGPAFPTSSVCLKKSNFKSIGGFDESEELIAWEDFDAWIRYSEIDQNSYKIEKTLGYLRVDDENYLDDEKAIKNIFTFKKKYLSDKKLPNWALFSLARSYYRKNEIEKSIFYLSQISLLKLNLKLLIKFIVFKIILKIKS